MIRIKLLFVCLAISISSFGQTKDSVGYKNDSVDIISVRDLQTVLKYMEDNATKKQYDQAVSYFNLLLQVVDSKRKTIIKHK